MQYFLTFISETEGGFVECDYGENHPADKNEFVDSFYNCFKAML